MKKTWLIGVLLLITITGICTVAAAHNRVVVIPLNTCSGAAAIPTVTSAGGLIWMDRNLGASRVATGSTDSAAYGDLYQWGRLADGHERLASATTPTNSTTDVPGHGNFILEPVFPYDWRVPKNDNLWQGVSGTNNPCPSGFRLPTVAEWDSERLSWFPKDAAGAFASPLKLVAAGLRTLSNGSLFDVGSSGYYWSSTVDGLLSRNLSFDGTDPYMSSYYRAHGLAVRCLKD